jgi:hypothetical protein
MRKKSLKSGFLALKRRREKARRSGFNADRRKEKPQKTRKKGKSGCHEMKKRRI